MAAIPEGGKGFPRLFSYLERASFALFVITLAWAPFPLGSNRPWAWSLLCLLVALSWLFWLISVWTTPLAIGRAAQGLVGPIMLGLAALSWGLLQVLPIVPSGWTHPVWQLAQGVLGRPIGATISLDGWHSGTELMKLSTYAMAAWLARVYAQRSDRALRLLQALIAIGACYAAYAIVMTSLGLPQFDVFYAGLPASHDLSGPFVNRNSYATYAGLMALCAGVRLVGAGASQVVTGRGARTLVMSLTQYIFGRGVPYLAAAVLTLSTLIATGSRAGNLATVAGLVSLLALALASRRGQWYWTAAISAAVVAGLVVLFVVNGDLIASRFNDISSVGTADDVRVMLWNAALRMIYHAPLLGQGLGTFIDAYPIYSDTMTRFVMDRAHNDFLEFAAGLGVPGAVLWWTSLGWLAVLCVRGAAIRRRNRSYPTLAVAATVLVAVHSAFDFSLQMPAISLTYAAILGLGVAQAFPTRRGDDG